MKLFSALLIAAATIPTAHSQTPTACSSENRTTDLQSCLTAIGILAEDTRPFWFGSSYYQRCPKGPQPYDPSCNLQPGLQLPQSISSMLFTPGTFSPQTLDRFLEVTFTSKPGEYFGCGKRFESDKPLQFTLDPLSPKSYNSWDARSEPEVTWRSSPGEYFSLVVVDVGYKFIHGIYMNLPGNDSQVVKPYHGPLNPYKTGNLYAFLLFSQPGKVTPDPRWTSRPPGTWFNVSEFMEVQELTGPVAMNWLLAAGDPYSVEVQRSMGIVNNCPTFVEDAIAKHNRPFLPPKPELEVFMNVTFNTPSLDFTSCCQNFYYPANSISLNPLGNGTIRAGYSRLTPTVNLRKSTLFPNPERDFAGNMHTLLMVDPDVPHAEAGTKERPLLHWLVLNIPNGMVPQGLTVRSYRGPAPPDQKPHFYYFLLYEQTWSLASDSPDRFVGSSCAGTALPRCQFNVTGFAAENGLRLVGATWMVSNHDEFVRYSWINRGKPEAEICHAVLGYNENCYMVAGSQTVSVGFLHVAISGVLAIKILSVK